MSQKDQIDKLNSYSSLIIDTAELDNQRLNNQISDLKNSLQLANNHLEKGEEEIEKFKAFEIEANSLKVKLEESDNLNAKIEVLSEEKKTLQEKYSNLKLEYKKVIKENEEYNLKINLLNSTLNQTKNEFQNLKKEYSIQMKTSKYSISELNKIFEQEKVKNSQINDFNALKLLNQNQQAQINDLTLRLLQKTNIPRKKVEAQIDQPIIAEILIPTETLAIEVVKNKKFAYNSIEGVDSIQLEDTLNAIKVVEKKKTKKVLNVEKSGSISTAKEVNQQKKRKKPETIVKEIEEYNDISPVIEVVEKKKRKKVVKSIVEENSNVDENVNVEIDEYNDISPVIEVVEKKKRKQVFKSIVEDENVNVEIHESNEISPVIEVIEKKKRKKVVKSFVEENSNIDENVNVEIDESNEISPVNEVIEKKKRKKVVKSIVIEENANAEPDDISTVKLVEKKKKKKLESLVDGKGGETIVEDGETVIVSAFNKVVKKRKKKGESVVDENLNVEIDESNDISPVIEVVEKKTGTKKLTKNSDSINETNDVQEGMSWLSDEKMKKKKVAKTIATQLSTTIEFDYTNTKKSNSESSGKKRMFEDDQDEPVVPKKRRALRKKFLGDL